MIARSIRGSFHPVTVYSAKANTRFFLTAQTPREGMRDTSRILLNDPVTRDSSAPGSRVRAPKRDAQDVRDVRDGASTGAGRLDKLSHLEFGDPRMASQIQLAARVIQRKIPIILRGQTGTGKEVFANALHSISPNGSGAFVAVNCASLPENLIERVVRVSRGRFHRRAARRPARQDRAGQWRHAVSG